MKLKLSSMLIAGALSTAGLAAWRHSQPRFKAICLNDGAYPSKGNPDPVMGSEIAPMRGGLIGADETETDTGAWELAIRELEGACSALQTARDRLQQVVTRNEEARAQLDDLTRQEVRAEVSESDSAQDMEGHGGAARFEYGQAVDKRAAAETALNTVRAGLSQARVEGDELDAEEGVARAELRAATTRFAAARATVAWWRDQVVADSRNNPR